MSTWQGHRMPRPLAKYYFEWMCDETNIWIRTVSKANYSPYHWWALPNQSKTQREQKSWAGKNSSCLALELAHWFLLAFGLKQKYQLFLVLMPTQLQTSTYSISSPDSQAFELGRKLHISSPRSSACWIEILGNSQPP